MVTLADLKAELPAYVYEIVDGSDEVGNRAIEKARIWIKAKISGCPSVIYDEEDAQIREILLKRACYELYVFADRESLAKDKKDDAFELLKAKFGSCVDPTNQGSVSVSGGTGSGVPGGCVIRRPRNKEAF